VGLEKTRGQNYHLSALLEGIEDGTVVLPEFQRDFDWTTNQIRQLVATVLLGWPLGSLLLLPGSKDGLFTLRSFQGAPTFGDPSLIVLDGQQRLTALYHALYGKGKGAYALRVDLLNDEQSVEDLEESIEWFPESRWENAYATPQIQYKNSLLPITALRSPSDFYEWRDEALQGGDRSALEKITATYRRSLAGLHQYEIPAAVINSDVTGAAVARIFERVNRLGKPLGTFDLVVAKSFTQDFNLRDAWEKACRDYPRLQAFLGEDGLPVLNVIALRIAESVRAQAVLDLTGLDVRENWHTAVKATDSALKFCVGHLGVWDSDWMPYKSILTILAALSVDISLDDHEAALKRWFWSTTLSASFDVASNTRAVRAYKDLRDDPEQFRTITLVAENLLESNKKQFGAIHRAILCFLASRDPLDLDTGRPLSDIGATGIAPEVGALSVFQRDSTSPDDSLHLRTLGMVLVSGRMARKHSSLDLASYPADNFSRQLIRGHDASPRRAGSFFSSRLRELTIALEMEHGLDVRIVDRR
jgi:hypothetical protein